jgi:rSAM/selenodomain-associated transferase 2
MAEVTAVRVQVNSAEAKLRARVSVVIPVFNEETTIGEQLEALSAMDGLYEILVVDGGSTDRTIQQVQARPMVKLLFSARRRSAQMNAGAKAAKGDVFLFLHADVRLPPNAVQWIETALSEPSVVGGAFRTWTVAEKKRTWLAPLLRLADLRSRYSSLPYGDQALFVRAEVFIQLGGFPNQPLMEDLELCRRLRNIGRIRTVPAAVRVSGRRFLDRPVYYAFLMNAFPLLYRFGMPSRILASLYGDPR